MKNDSIKLKQIQFIRFLAFLLIFLWHSSMWDIKIGNFKLPGSAGAAFAVSLFFILSGWLSGCSDVEYSKIKFKDIISYLIKKIKKFYPLYIITVLISITYSNLPAAIAAHDWNSFFNLFFQFVKNVLLIQSWFPVGYFTYNGVGWFLSSIMFCYIFTIPIKGLIYKMEKKKHSDIKLFAIALIIISVEILYLYLIRNYNREYLGYIVPISRLGEYISGVIFGHLFMRLVNVNKKYNKALFTILEVLVLFGVTTLLYLIYPKWMNYVVAWLIPAYITVFVYSFNAGYISKIFSSKLLVKLGDLSFGCFLIHPLVISILSKIHKISGITMLGNAFCRLFCLLLTLLLAYVHDRYVFYKKNYNTLR